MAVPPFFQPADSDTLAQWLSHGIRTPHWGEQTMAPMEQELLEGWQALSKRGEVFDVSDLHTTIGELTGKKRALSTTQRRVYIACSQLAEAGVVWRERAGSILGPGHGRAMIYELRHPRDTAARWKGEPGTPQDNPAMLTPRQKKEMLESPKLSEAAEQTHDLLRALGWFDVRSSTQVAAKPADEAWTMHLISQLIERCSRSSSKERIDNLQSHIRMNGELIEVEASRVHHRWEKGFEYGLIAAEDSQLILAIITMAMQGIARDIQAGNTQPENRVTFDLLALSRELNPAGGRSALRTFQHGMARIINTVYRLSRVGDQGRERLTFRLLDDVVEGEGSPIDCDDGAWSPSDAGMRFFSFSLNRHIWSGLLKRQGWLVHPELLYERSGLIHRVYHHLRSHARTDSVYKIEAVDLAKWLVSGQGSNPRRSRQRFREELKEQFENRARRTPPLLGSIFAAQAQGEAWPGAQRKDITTLKLFDLDIRLQPCDEGTDNYWIEAKQSKETLQLLQRQEELKREFLAYTEHHDSGRLSQITHDPTPGQD